MISISIAVVVIFSTLVSAIGSGRRAHPTGPVEIDQAVVAKQADACVEAGIFTVEGCKDMVIRGSVPQSPATVAQGGTREQ